MKKTLLITIVLFATSSFAQSIKLIELKKINFIGNNLFSDAKLKDVIAIKESPSAISQSLNSLLGLGEEATYFDSLSLNAEMLRLKSFYFNHGYFNAKIEISNSIDLIEKTAEITFNIIEGKQNKYKSIDVFGLDSLTGNIKRKVNEVISIDTTENYNYDYVSNMNLNILTYLQDNGYMFANIDSTLILLIHLKIM